MTMKTDFKEMKKSWNNIIQENMYEQFQDVNLKIWQFLKTMLRF